MKKMYKKPEVESEDPAVAPVMQTTEDKRIKSLESKVSQLNEEVTQLRALIRSIGRDTRRQTADINNITTAIRNK